MNHDKTFVQILTGNDQGGASDLKQAVAARAAVLIPSFTPRRGDYAYDGHRCTPKNLGWRFLQNVRLSRLPQQPGGCVGPRELAGADLPEPTIEAIERGEFDRAIEATYHDAAGAEWWYRYEKQW